MEEGASRKQGLKGIARDFFTSLYRRRGIFYFLYRSSWDSGYPLLCLHSLCWMARAGLTGEKLVHFIGDSHTDPYRMEKRMITHHVGRGTAHNLKDENSSSGSGTQLWKVLGGINKKRDAVGLVFGEIDCRVHFHYQYLKHKKKVPIEALIDSTVSNYGEVVRRVKGQGYQVFVVGVPPAASQKNIYGYPFYGKPKERSEISQKFNSKLQQWCRKNSVPFIGIMTFLSDRDGFLKRELASDEVHANKKLLPFVRKKLEEKMGIAL
jgi:lysophospholipase L1-like esterase